MSVGRERRLRLLAADYCQWVDAMRSGQHGDDEQHCRDLLVGRVE